MYSNEKKARSVGFRRIYLMLDEATLTFNSSADEVIVANWLMYLFHASLIL